MAYGCVANSHFGEGWSQFDSRSEESRSGRGQGLDVVDTAEFPPGCVTLVSFARRQRYKMNVIVNCAVWLNKQQEVAIFGEDGSKVAENCGAVTKLR